MIERMEGKLGEHHSGEMRLETAQAKAERILREELTRLGWDAGQLQSRRKSDPRKLAIDAAPERKAFLALSLARSQVIAASANDAHHWWRATDA